MKKNDDDLNSLRLRIARAAGSLENIVRLSDEIGQTQWQELIDSDLVACYGCKRDIRYIDATWSPFVNKKTAQEPYCPTCVPKMLEYYVRQYGSDCSLCHTRFIYVWSFPSSVILCENCKNTNQYSLDILKTEHRRIAVNLERTEQSYSLDRLRLNEWLKTLEHFSWKCAYCSGNYDCLEHFIPVSLGGLTIRSNCVPACNMCNTRKREHYPQDVKLIPTEAMQQVQSYLNQFS